MLKMNLDSLWREYKRLSNPQTYKVDLSERPLVH